MRNSETGGEKGRTGSPAAPEASDYANRQIDTAARFLQSPTKMEVLRRTNAHMRTTDHNDAETHR